ncbi:hypothetical protein BC826DRAFT_1180266 [Russula brevipes]|nr:hypothetical protein BC826DRAFT_1180266 [Russula brevipes]
MPLGIGSRRNLWHTTWDRFACVLNTRPDRQFKGQSRLGGKQIMACRFVRHLGLKTSLDEYKVPPEDLPAITERALSRRSGVRGDVAPLEGCTHRHEVNIQKVRIPIRYLVDRKGAAIWLWMVVLGAGSRELLQFGQRLCHLVVNIFSATRKERSRNEASGKCPYHAEKTKRLVFITDSVPSGILPLKKRNVPVRVVHNFGNSEAVRRIERRAFDSSYSAVTRLIGTELMSKSFSQTRQNTALPHAGPIIVTNRLDSTNGGRDKLASDSTLPEVDRQTGRKIGLSSLSVALSSSLCISNTIPEISQITTSTASSSSLSRPRSGLTRETRRQERQGVRRKIFDGTVAWIVVDVDKSRGLVEREKKG